MTDRLEEIRRQWEIATLTDDQGEWLLAEVDRLRAEDRVRQAKSALTHLGQAWRGDWSEFDGRTLRAQLDDLSLILDGKRTLAQFLAGCGICPDHSCWPEHCWPEHCRGQH